MQVLISNNGIHSADQWGLATAKIIFDTGQLGNGRLMQATELQTQIAKQLSQVYQHVMTDDMDTDTAANDVVNNIQRLVLGSPWESQIGSDEWADLAIDTVQSHISTIKQLERSS